LVKQGYQDYEANHVANITIVDDFLNKRDIRAKAPATYMKAYARENTRLDRTMRTHLIQLKSCGVWQNDYRKFIRRRCQLIARELEKRIIHQKADDIGQAVVQDDVDIETESLNGK
jgi:hypothetical protein